MSYLLTARERKLLEYLQIDFKSFRIMGQFPQGTGKITVTRLTDLGLLETGPGRHGATGWRLSDDGWRCMYGQTNAEMLATGRVYTPLKVWSWPPTIEST